MNILDKILADKYVEVRARKGSVPISELEKSAFFSKDCLSMKQSLIASSTGIISEFKRKSPSKGWIHENADVVPDAARRASE